MDAPATFAEAQEVLAASLPGYTPRPAQMSLAAEIEQALEDERHGLFQAGTGTGKSLAILIPLIQWAKAKGQRAVVATFTKALQSQYARNDLPFLQEHLGIDFTWAVLKGRTNYPCFAKREALKSPSPAQRRVMTRMDELSTPEAILAGDIIDREDFPEMTDEAWRDFAMSAAECPGSKDCPFAKQCFAERAKAKAAEADIVITNTAYLMQDLKLRLMSGGTVALLGEVGVIAVDEAHTLPDAATGALEDSMSPGALARLARDIEGYLEAEGGDSYLGHAVETAAGEFWDLITSQYRAFARQPANKGNPMPLSQHKILETLGGSITVLYQAIDTARREVKNTRPFDDTVKVAKSRILRRTDSWMQRLETYVTDDDGKTVRWAEEITLKARRGGAPATLVTLRSAPVSVAGFLREAMWDECPVIMSSATLTTGTRKVNGTRAPDFDYLSETLGLNRGEAATFDAGSPFDFQRQSRLYVPDGRFPAPEKNSMPAWRAAAQAVTRELVTKSGGGALLLFTSRSAMEESFTALAGQFEGAGLTVLKQGDFPTPELVRLFKADGHAVLFALRTFFEGIDVPGKALRLVVLDKLPFSVPTDLLNMARVDALIRKYNNQWAGFDRLTIPSMILTLTQAFGRLIRHSDDSGLVAILDNRLRSKRYGKQILAALPPARQLDSIRDAGEYLESIR
jgi:ATP-dependent DNA helicase DinG